MSHTTKLRSVAVRDTDALKSAVKTLQQRGHNIELVENDRPRMYFAGQGDVCEYVAKLGSGYDVGFKKQDDGTYQPQFDTHGGHVAREVGASCPMPHTREGQAEAAIGQLMQQYTHDATVNAAVAQGYFVEDTETDEEGNVHLHLAGM